MRPADAVADPDYGAAFAALALQDGVDDSSVLTLFLAVERERGIKSR
jgi:hypothetical protein